MFSPCMWAFIHKHPSESHGGGQKPQCYFITNMAWWAPGYYESPFRSCCTSTNLCWWGFILFGPNKAGNLAVLDHKKGRNSGHVLITSVRVGEGTMTPSRMMQRPTHVWLNIYQFYLCRSWPSTWFLILIVGFLQGQSLQSGEDGDVHRLKWSRPEFMINKLRPPKDSVIISK